VIASGGAPFWGPANVNPAKRPPPPACHVPAVVGKTLGAAKRAITKGDCKVGKVTRKHASRKHRGKVISQKPKAGGSRPVGATVNLVVGR
jgi:beta-lactam-binding protein with PASTA domain